jgi:hypothetical protein|tara:strand:- start:7726 stop:8031 length:306 start_codon:yes stop_codon:yes gene_type:complete
MFEIGHSVIRVYPKIGEENNIVEGEITSISENADGETDVTVMYNDGAVKVYEFWAMANNPRIIVHDARTDIAENESLKFWLNNLDKAEEALGVLQREYLEA